MVVVLLPVDEGILCIRRGIEPKRGHLALPGGFHDFGETWQEAGAREVYEETGISLDPAELREWSVLSPPPPDALVLIFARARQRVLAELPEFRPTPETTERVIVTTPQELAFPLHTKVLQEYFTAFTPRGSNAG